MRFLHNFIKNLNDLRKIKYKRGKKIQPVILEYTGIHTEAKTEMQLFVYDNETVSEFQDIAVEDISKNLGINKVNWLNVHGLNDVECIQNLSESLQIDTFMLGDILNTNKRSKIE